MSGTFDCPSCGAPLQIEEGGDAVIVCKYCGKSVLVPPELREPTSLSEARGGAQGADLGLAMEQAARLTEVAELVRQGQKIEAIKLYRQLSGLGLKESKDIIEQFELGGTLEFTSVAVGPGEFILEDGDVDKDALLAEIRELLRNGQKIEAIKVFRQAFDSSLKESKDVVEAIEAGNRTSLEGYVRGATAPKALPAQPKSIEPRPAVAGWVWVLVIVSILACGFLPLLFSSLASLAPLAIVFQSLGMGDLIPTSPADQNSDSPVIQLPVEIPGVAPTAIEAPVSGPAQVVLSFGGEGSGPGLFTDARSIAVDRSSGAIYVAEYQGGRVQAFDTSGKFITQWSLGDRNAIIYDLAAGRDGLVYVSSGGKILRYEGATGALIGALQVEGNDDYLESIALRLSGDLVAIGGGENILWIDAAGLVTQSLPSAISSISDDSELDTHLAVDGQDYVYALGRFNNAVFKFAPDGKYQNRFGSAGEEPGQFRAPFAIAVDNQSRVYVSDIKGIQIFDRDGRYLDTIEPQQGVVFGMAFNDLNELFTVSNDQKVNQYTLTIGE